MKSKKLLVLGTTALLMVSGLVGCSKKKNTSSAETPEEILERVKGELGSYYGDLTSGVKGTIDLLTEVDGVSISYTVTNDAYFAISEDGTKAEAKPLYIGDSYTATDGTTAKVDDTWYATTVMTATLTYGDLTATKSFNVKIVATAKVQTYDEYIAVKNDGAVCVQVIIDKLEYEPKYSYNIGWGHDKDGNSYYFYNLGTKYIDADKIAEGNEIIISGTKSIYSGYHELIKPDSVILVSKGNAIATAKDCTSQLKAAKTTNAEALEPLAAARLKATDLVVSRIPDPTEYYVAKTDTLDAYLNKYFFYVTAGDGGTEYPVYVSRSAEGDAALAKVKSLAVDDVISIDDFFGEWYNGFQFTVIDADKITKTGAVTRDDDYKLAAAKADLEAELPSTMAAAIELPVTCTYSTTVTWTLAETTAATLGEDGKTLSLGTVTEDTDIKVTGVVALPGSDKTVTVEKTITVKCDPSTIRLAKSIYAANSANYTTTLKGKVVLIQGTSFYIDDGYSAIMIYNCNKTTYTPVLGDVISVAATVTCYNGLYETSSGSITDVTKLTEKITARDPFVISATNWTATGVEGYDCGLVTGTLTYDSTTTAASSSTNGKYVFKCGDTAITVTVSKNATNVATIASAIAALSQGDKVTLTGGAISMYKGTPQIDICNTDSIVKVTAE